MKLILRPEDLLPEHLRTIPGTNYHIQPGNVRFDSFREEVQVAIRAVGVGVACYKDGTFGPYPIDPSESENVSYVTDAQKFNLAKKAAEKIVAECVPSGSDGISYALLLLEYIQTLAGGILTRHQFERIERDIN